MTSVEDYFVDQFRDSAGRLSGQIPVQAWIKPNRVVLEIPRPTSSLRDILDGHAGATTPQLTIEVSNPADARPPLRRAVKPKAGLLDEFMGLSSAKPEAIRSFAEKYGPLMTYSRVERRTDEKLLVLIEDCEVWTYFAKSLRALIHIAAKIAVGGSPRRDDWDVIAETPKAVREATEKAPDLFDPMLVSGETGWSARTLCIRRGISRDRAMWLGLLNTLMSLGRVRPWMLWEGKAEASRPRLVFSGPNLLSYLSLQVCLVVAKQGEFAVCSHCQTQYTSARAPKSGQRNFCPGCRKRGVPEREAQRDRRSRLRDIKQPSL